MRGDRQRTAIHAAAYVADDMVFTKNGESCTQPWILMHMQDMIDTYAVKHPDQRPAEDDLLPEEDAVEKFGVRQFIAAFVLVGASLNFTVSYSAVHPMQMPP